MKIINEYFEVGQQYKGKVNDELFFVKEIKEPGFYKTESGGIYKVRHRVVVFMNERTGKTAEVDYRTAQRLLLDRL